MRRITAVLLSIVMCIGVLSGCSGAEVGYLDISRKMMQADGMSFDADVEMNVDLDVLKAAITDFAAEYMGVTEESLTELDGLTGKKTVTMHFSGKEDIQNLDVYMKTSVTVDGKTYDLGEMIYGPKLGMYVSKEALLNGARLVALLDGKENAYDDDLFYTRLQNAFMDETYIRILSEDDMVGTVPEDMTALYDSMIEFLLDGFDGFTTDGMIMKTGSNTYRLKANAKEYVELGIKATEYIANNLEKVCDALEVFLTDYKQYCTAEEAEALEYVIVRLQSVKGNQEEHKEEIMTALEEMKDILENDPDAKKLMDLLEGLVLEASITDNGDTFRETEDLTFQYQGKEMFALHLTDYIKLAAVTVDVPSDCLTLEETDALYQQVENSVNPVTSASITYAKDAAEDPTATIDFLHETELLFGGSDLDFSNFIIEDGRIYLPLRMICDGMDETVRWDSAAKQAYVVQEVDGTTKETPMSGLIYENRTYVKIRDFEALGYTVDFDSQSDPYYNFVTLTK